MNWAAPFLLAFVAGFVDTATFVGARGVFSAHVTGNFVLFAVAATKGVQEIDLLKLALFVPFVLALWFVARVNRHRKDHPWFEPGLLLIASVLLFIPAVYFFGVTRALGDDLWDVANGMIMLPVLAMGIQNGLYKVVEPTEPMTTVMTGNVIQLVIGSFGGSTGVVPAGKLVAIVRLVIGFAIGCLFGAGLVTSHSLGALLVPALILLALSVFKLRKVSR